MNLGEKLTRIIEINEAENRALREKEDSRKKMLALAKRNKLEKILETVTRGLTAQINAGRIPHTHVQVELYRELINYKDTGASVYKDIIARFFDNFRSQGVDVELVIGMNDEFETTYIIKLVPLINKVNS